MRDFNFFAPYQGEKKKVVNKRIYVYTLVTIMIVVIFGSLAYNTINIYVLDKNIKKYTSEINNSDIQQKVKDAEDINKKMAIVNNYNSGIDIVKDNIDKKDMITSNLLNSINSKIPKEMSFTNISIEENKVSFQGVAKSRQDIADFEYGLKNLDFISDTHVGSITVDESKPGTYKFDLKSTLKDVGNNENK